MEMACAFTVCEQRTIRERMVVVEGIKRRPLDLMCRILREIQEIECRARCAHARDELRVCWW